MVKKVEVTGYVPGSIGRITELHAQYYFQNWGFGKFFEAKVATELSAFLNRFDEYRDGLWTLCLDNQVEGSIVIDGVKAASEGAHLRWFILSAKMRGQGLGNELMEKAVCFCREHQYHHIYLWTFEGLDAARHLYEKFGFRLVEEQTGEQWGTTVNEQKFALNLK
ncbi:MAG: GNAT family N-acetyltransferase [Desulfobacterales bacterium]|nr:MAG: GNAT family N-acetyltransferase [Desulfobacterales bacterium]